MVWLFVLKNNLKDYSMNICCFPQWIITLLSVFVGALLGFLSNFGIEIWRYIYTAKKIRKAILAEISANLDSAEKGDVSHLLWIDDIYKSNLSKLDCFDFDLLPKIIRFYAKVAQYKDRITRGYDKELEDQEKLNQTDIKGKSTYWGTVGILVNEIKSLGKEILNHK